MPSVRPFPIKPAIRAWHLLLVLLLASAWTSPLQAQTEAKKRPAGSPQRPRAATEPASAASKATQQQQRQLQAEQRELQQRLDRLKQQLAAAETSHSEAVDALAESEAAISAANRKLRELAQTRQRIERQIVTLQDRSRSAAARQSEQERQLSEVLRAQYSLAQEQTWQSLVAGADPNRTQRDLTYMDYVARARIRLIGELRERQQELDELAVESRDKHIELTAVAAEEKKNHAQLLDQQQARRRTLERLARQIGARRESIATLERDEKRLGSLVERIGQLLAEQRLAEQRQAERRLAEQRRRAERERQAAAAPSARRRGDNHAASTAAAAAAIELPAGTEFEKLRGKLTLPVKGEITAQFGAARRGEGNVAAPSWKGIFIRAAQGTEVAAVAAGTVVFADWLRGFGNLMIIDHGEGFLSVYGNNETLLLNNGDRTAAGDAVATVGNTGGNSEPGLYFELRFHGRPIDPLKWAAAR